jgi:hypothetical protein
MRRKCKLFIFVGFASLLAVNCNIGMGWAKSEKTQKAGSTGLQQRIDFGNAYIMGQSIKSGAVYLLHRKKSDIKSMLQYREDYRQEILEDFTIQVENIQETHLKTQN